MTRYVLIATFDADPIAPGAVDHPGIASAIVRNVPGATVTTLHDAGLYEVPPDWRHTAPPAPEYLWEGTTDD